VPRGEIRYLQIPTVDVDASASFYERALGWTIRTRADGSTAFDDTTAEVSGEWVLDRQPAGDSGVLVYARAERSDGLRAVPGVSSPSRGFVAGGQHRNTDLKGFKTLIHA
jgi:predicted enzyme related to lactoylglutathione lyase